MALSDTISKQIGPLPAWGWGVVVVGGYVAYRFIRGGAGSSQAGVPVDLSGTTTDLSGGGGGGSGTDTGTTITTPPPVDTSGIGSALQAALDAIKSAAAAAQQQVTQSAPQVATPTPSPTITPLPGETPFPGQAAPITITTLPNNFGQIVTSGPLVTAKQLTQIAQTGGLPTGISWGTPSGAYKVGSIMPTNPVDLSAPSHDTATYLQQIFAIEAGAQIDPSLWPSEVTNPQWRKQTIASLTGAILASGPAYNPGYGGLTPNQVKYAANIASPFAGLNLNPVTQTALYNAANNPSLLTQSSGAPPTIDKVTNVGSSGPAPSTSKPLMTLSEFNAANRAATIDRLNSALGTKATTTETVNKQIAANYAKYVAAHS